MPNFGERSKGKLITCHPLIREVSYLAIRYWDITIIHGFRGKELQDELVAQGLSKTPWPTSQHNHLSDQEDVDAGYANDVDIPLSLAFDFAPWYPVLPHVRWKHEDEFYHMAGLIIGMSEDYLNERGFWLRYGGDWDDDQDLHDQTFLDLGHLELRRSQ
jgi:hypothetical protein